MRRWLDAAWTPAVLLVLGYGLFAMLTQAWPIGWIDMAQQSLFGAYWPKASLLVFVLLALVLLALVWQALEAIAGPPARSPSAPGAPATAPARPKPPSVLMLQVAAGIIVLTWVLGLGVAAWITHQQQDDAAATYRPLQAGDAGVAARDGDHLALRGVPLRDRSIVQRVTSSGTTTVHASYVAIAGAGWRPGDAVRWVVVLDGPAPLQPGPREGRTAAETLQVRVAGSVPIPAASRFAEIGVPLAQDTRLLRMVAQQPGRPAMPPTDAFEVALWGCGLLSVVTAMTLGLASVLQWRRERRGPRR